MRKLLLTALATITLVTPVMAEDNGLALPPAGHTILNLSVTEQTKLAQDTLTASLRYELDGTSANDVQDKINKAVAEAVAEAKNYTDVKTTTGSYYVYVYDQQDTVDPRTGQPMSTTKKWRGSQSIDLESKNASKFLELAGKIQSKGFIMNGMNYSLSEDKAKSVQDTLMQKALTSLSAKAKVAAAALGKSGFDIVDVNINGADQPIYPVYAKAMMAMDSAAPREVAAPTAEAGESTVSLTVNARVLLKP
ncbi:MAG: SIMPL domain-containing protein [Alphaproteobacteria bacterium]|nr:SIMPL domain-containing protein [Alphaproteobacteria bacterium]